MGGGREGTARTRERNIDTAGTKLGLCERGRQGKLFKLHVVYFTDIAHTCTCMETSLFIPHMHVCTCLIPCCFSIEFVLLV